MMDQYEHRAQHQHRRRYHDRRQGRSQSMGDLTLLDLVPLLWQRRGVVMLVFVSVMMLAAAIIPRWGQSYRALARIGFVSEVPITASDGQGAAERLETRMAAIRGSDVLTAALAVLRGEGVAFLPGPERQTSWISLLAANASALGYQDWPQTSETEQRELGILRSRLDVARIGNASVIEISAVDRDPFRSQQIVNAVIDSYLWQRETDRKQGLRAQLSETRNQLIAANARLETAETALADWQQKAGFVEADENRLMLDRIYALNAELETARRDLERAKLLAEGRAQARSVEELLALPPVANHEMVRKLAAQYDDVRRSYVAMDQRYGPKHPAMIAKTGELATVKTHLAEAVALAARQIDLDLRQAQKQHDVITAQRDAWQARLSDRHDRALGQAVLVRAVDVARNEADMLGRQEQEFRASLAAFQSDTMVMQSANLPEMAEFPTRRDFWMAALLMALFAAVLVGFLRHHFDQAIGDDDDIEHRFGLPVFARTPQVSGGGTAPVAMEEAVGHLGVLINILAKTGAFPGKAHVTCIGSAVTGEGKSRLARDLAISFAASGFRTLLLDGDLRHPTRMGKFDVNGDFTALLAGDSSAKSAVRQNVDGMGFDYLGARASVPGHMATGLIETGLADVLTGLRAEYDRIVVDSPPILSVADAVLLMGMADTRLMLVRRGYSKNRDVNDAIGYLQSARLHADGVVLTVAKLKPAYGHADAPVMGAV
ncbi:GumC family protein [Thalassospira alkalitolerans]|uniref:GumC family protein n=1 Tax=Thalassospira alkalitolerans TaxID=1293890 RepID=UPI003AA9C6A3